MGHRLNTGCAHIGALTEIDGVLNYPEGTSYNQRDARISVSVRLEKCHGGGCPCHASSTHVILPLDFILADIVT